MSLTDVQRDEIVAQYLAGEGVKQIAYDYGITKAYVCLIARKRNVLLRRPPVTRLRMAEARKR